MFLNAKEFGRKLAGLLLMSGLVACANSAHAAFWITGWCYKFFSMTTVIDASRE
jgi:hypothetical protein